MKFYDEELNIFELNFFSYGSVIYDYGYYIFNMDFERMEIEYKSDSNLVWKLIDSIYWLLEGLDSIFMNSLNNEKMVFDSKVNFVY